MTNLQLSPAFLLVAVFERPTRVPLNEQFVEGTYAPSLLMNTDTATRLMGATSQFRPNGIRLNVPGTTIAPNLQPIDVELQEKILDSQHPSAFGLALKVDRTVTPVAGKAWLFVGNTEGDSFAFDFPNFTASNQIFDLRAGIGTAANGIHYRASVSLLRFQIWIP